MLEIRDLELTPLQVRDIEDSDPALVASWLAAASEPEIRSPTGYFLAGMRSGEPPWGPNREHAQNLRLAERWVENVGLLYDQEEAVLDELFGRNGLLRHHAGDVQLQKRMLLLWAANRPRGEQVEREQIDRAQRNSATYFLLRKKP
jgi:hypothetical protein